MTISPKPTFAPAAAVDCSETVLNKGAKGMKKTAVTRKSARLERMGKTISSRSWRSTCQQKPMSRQLWPILVS